MYLQRASTLPCTINPSFYALYSEVKFITTCFFVNGSQFKVTSKMAATFYICYQNYIIPPWISTNWYEQLRHDKDTSLWDILYYIYVAILKLLRDNRIYSSTICCSLFYFADYSQLVYTKGKSFHLIAKYKRIFFVNVCQTKNEFLVCWSSKKGLLNYYGIRLHVMHFI